MAKALSKEQYFDFINVKHLLVRLGVTLCPGG